ncbi:MAG TPA: glycosyl hydrolase family 28-related protein [Bacteriovoracaceae bacterium]|nr:glycosyl hydrolase family 28-related protein [Bacteriovoracaceae bacterium]
MATNGIADVRIFGAKGITQNPDGSYHDDTPFIKSALNSISATGGTLYFPPGYYNVKETLYIPSNVTIQGHSSFDNCQIDLTTPGIPLLAVQDGNSNVTFRDITLVSRTVAKWPRTSPADAQLIRNENTTAISLRAAGVGINRIVIENVRAINFTYGISATSEIPGYDATIADVRIRNYASDTNEFALHTLSRQATNWDVQNMNVYPMYHDQNGIFLEKSGKMGFLQLSCAGPMLANIGTEEQPVLVDSPDRSNTCAKLWGNGETYFKNMHVEGPRIGLCVGSECNGQTGNVGENPNPIFVENSAVLGQFHRQTNLITTGNRFWLDFVGSPRFTFHGTGQRSFVHTCGDVYVSYYDHLIKTTTEPDENRFPGLLNPYSSCMRQQLVPDFNFKKGFIREVAPSGKEINVRTLGAGNGNAVQDTQVFLKAIDLATSGGRIWIPAGTYKINKTLELRKGESLVGEEGAHLMFEGSGSLIKVVATSAVVKGIMIRGLQLSGWTAPGAVGIDFTNDLPNSGNVGGAATDFQLQDLSFNGFSVGLRTVASDGQLGDKTQPMFDSISVKNVRFNSNTTGALLKTQNASNWNFEDTLVEFGSGQTGIVVNGIGLLSFRGLSCAGYALAETCLVIQRQNALFIDGLTSSNVKRAIKVTWENGWTQFPIVIRNSDLSSGFDVDGKIILTSINNTYPVTPGDLYDGSKIVRFAETPGLPGSDANKSPGVKSRIFSCDDRFVDSMDGSAHPPWTSVGVLENPVTTCR